jgi:conjugative transfer pilus assembly protein TraH
MKKTILALSLMLSASPVSPVHAAGWVDDWLDQSNTTQAGYFEGQQRGYYSVGSFKGRWKSTADFPVTVEKPRVKSGCGGIDVFMGGFSFMDSDYLGDKLQNILTNAAGVAFDLALKTLCEQCSNTIKNFEAMSDALNQMQIDECAAGKELVGIVADKNGIRSADAMQERLGTAIKENKLSSGVSEMWDKMTKEEKSNKGEVQTGDVEKIVSSCPNDLREIFIEGDTLLGTLGEKMHIPTSYLNLIRGLVGDVKLEGSAKAYKVSTMPPCPQNTPESLKSFLDGEIYAMTEAGACSRIGDVNRDLVGYYSTQLTGIATKMKNTTAALSPEEVLFLDTNPISPLPILKNAIATRTEGQAISGLADITAKAHTLQMVTDLYARAEMIARKSQEVLEKKTPSTSDPDKCAAYVFADKAAQNIESMLEKINQVRVAANASYMASMGEMNAVLSYMESMEHLDNRRMAELTRRYGKDMAARLQ